jgi:CHASE3 domain sensor protein
MSTVTESDLRELKDLINTRFSELDRKIDGIDKKLDIHIVRTDEQLKAINNTLAQMDKRTDQRFDDTNRRIDGINTRLNTITLGFFSIIGILVTGLLGIVGKVVFFPNP